MTSGRGCTRFSKYDFSKFFWQFPLDDASKKCTAFVVPGMGTLCYNRLPMGVTCAPAIAQAFVNKIFRIPYDGPGPMHGKMALGNICVAFINDLLAFGAISIWRTTTRSSFARWQNTTLG